jgi:hypothetical protein
MTHPEAPTTHGPLALGSSEGLGVTHAPEKTREQQRLERFDKLVWEFQNEMPSDVMLKGDGTLWTVTHGDTRPRKITQQDALKLLYTAIQRAAQLVSI